MVDTEVDAIMKISEILSQVMDDNVRARVLRWACDKYAPCVTPVAAKSQTGALPATTPDNTSQTGAQKSKELPGIAMISEDGQFKLTVRDPKAKSTNDAALRLALVTIRAYQQLTGQTLASSKAVVVPTLRHWRAYDGNTRRVLAGCKGIVRTGDLVTLDAHAVQEAEKLMEEMLNEDVAGTWRPSQKSRRKVTGGDDKKSGPETEQE